MSDQARRKGLGRGLAALIDDIRPDDSAPPRQPDTTLPIEALRPNPNQPRKTFDDAELDALTESIRVKGVIQPLIVRPDPSLEGGYQIVAGERRWRAAQRAQLHSLPVVIRAFDDREVLEIAILENVQRADLNPIEEAGGYARLVEQFGHTQEQLASAMGKSRSHIANALRLLGLPEAVQSMLSDGRLTAGHARALITAPDPAALARQVVALGLSVRETERLAKRAATPPPPRALGSKDPDTAALEADLSAALQMRVALRHKGQGGEILISYKDLDALDALCARLMA